MSDALRERLLLMLRGALLRPQRTTAFRPFLPKAFAGAAETMQMKRRSGRSALWSLSSTAAN